MSFAKALMGYNPKRTRARTIKRKPRVQSKRINIKTSDFTRVTNDVYGNPRYAIHFLDLVPSDISARYDDVLRINKKLGLGGRKFHNKQYGGGLVFQSYSLPHTAKHLNSKLNTYWSKR